MVTRMVTRSDRDAKLFRTVLRVSIKLEDEPIQRIAGAYFRAIEYELSLTDDPDATMGLADNVEIVFYYGVEFEINEDVYGSDS